jgi:hypothetical protein
VDIATLRLPDGNFGGLYTDSKKDVNPSAEVQPDFSSLVCIFIDLRPSA